MSLAGTEIIHYDTASGSVITPATTTAAAIALLAAASPARSVNTIAAGASTTITAAAVVAGMITRSGPVANFTDTFDSAANIIAALPSGTPLSTTWLLFIRNTTPLVETLAAGVGVSLSGNIVVPPNSVYIGMVAFTGGATITITGLATAPLDTGAIETNTAISTVGAGTLTAAAIVGGVITRSGSTANYTDTTDTAANIIAAIPNSYVGQSWRLTIINTVAFAQTLAGGSGVTLSGLAGPIPANSTARCLVTYTAAAAVTIQVISVAYNTASGYDPATVQTQFGSGTGTFFEEGLLGRQVSQPGISPGGTGTDNVIYAFTLPASSLDGVNNRGLLISGQGTFAANANAKRIKIYFNATTATVGSAVTGGTVIADTGSTNQSGSGWQINAAVYKYGAAGSNTQITFNQGSIVGTTHLGVAAPVLTTATESGSILIAITGNCTTTATDIVGNLFTILAQN